MSLYDAMLNTPKPWLNLFVNSITNKSATGNVQSFTATVEGPSFAGTSLIFYYIIQNGTVLLTSKGSGAVALPNGITVNNANIQILNLPPAIVPANSSSQLFPIGVYGSLSNVLLSTPGSISISNSGFYINISMANPSGWSSGVDAYSGWSGFTIQYLLNIP